MPSGPVSCMVATVTEFSIHVCYLLVRYLTATQFCVWVVMCIGTQQVQGIDKLYRHGLVFFWFCVY